MLFLHNRPTSSKPHNKYPCCSPNTSGQEIKIDIVDACECTKVDFPRGAIAPGAKGRFDVVFDSTDKDAAETIGNTVVFRETDAAGNPRIESIEYKFDLVK